MNKAILIGNLGKDVELRYTAEQTPVANFTLATTEWSKDKEVVTWHQVVAWSKTAENCAKYLTKGSKVCVEGRIQNRSYTDKEGVKRYTSEVVANHVEFLSTKKDGQQQNISDQRFDPDVAQQQPPTTQPSRQFNDDDIPF